MPKYVIHVGPPKAGSKYLQSSLTGLRRRLERLKIFYPATLMTAERRPTHAALDPLLRAGGPNPALEQAFAEINEGGYRQVVLSWEGACALPEPALHYLRGLIGPQNEVQVVYYLRRFSERMPSLWKQEIKAGRTVTLPEAVARATRMPIDGPEYNATLLWERWVNVFGRASLRIVSLNNLREHKIDLFDHFAVTFLKWSGTMRPKRPTVHESPDAVDTEMGRALNALHLARGGTETQGVFVAYQAIKPQLEFGPILAAMERHTATIRIDDKATAFLPVYQALTEYKDRLASPEYGTEMFTRGVSDVSYVRQDYVWQPGVMPAMQTIYRAVRAALENPPKPPAVEAAEDEDAEAEASEAAGTATAGVASEASASAAGQLAPRAAGPVGRPGGPGAARKGPPGGGGAGAAAAQKRAAGAAVAGGGPGKGAPGPKGAGPGAAHKGAAGAGVGRPAPAGPKPAAASPPGAASGPETPAPQPAKA
jgi:hypothetical protein